VACIVLHLRAAIAHSCEPQEFRRVLYRLFARPELFKG